MIRSTLKARSAAAVILAAAVAAACGGSGQSPQADAASDGPAFVQADVDFAVQLSQHHGQALHMAELAAARARSTAVVNMATEIATSYAPQIDTIAGWIQAWAQAGATLPAHEIGDGPTGPGMLPERAVLRLESLKGTAFDRQFVTLMARHHRRGQALVGQQLTRGINPEARALAERLRTDQTRQLTQLD